MISNAGSPRGRVSLAPALALLSLGLAAQPALAGVNEAEARLPVSGSEATLLPEAQARDEGVLNGSNAAAAPSPIGAHIARVSG